jgi:uncharacterized protein (DUF2062 family)
MLQTTVLSNWWTPIIRSSLVCSIIVSCNYLKKHRFAIVFNEMSNKQSYITRKANI